MTYTAKRITAVLVVKAVEPSLDFWETRLGFQRVADVPHEGTLGFAILVHGGTEVMLQSEASVRADMGNVHGVGAPIGSSTTLFVEVDDLEAVIGALGSYPVALPRRTTFYGMHEIGYVEPGGHLVVFAQPVKGG